jgi:hypothetical protein
MVVDSGEPVHKPSCISVTREASFISHIFDRLKYHYLPAHSQIKREGNLAEIEIKSYTQ